MGGFVGQVPTTFYFTSYNQYDGTKTRLAKDVHCLAAFGEEGGGIKYLGGGRGFVTTLPDHACFAIFWHN